MHRVNRVERRGAALVLVVRHLLPFATEAVGQTGPSGGLRASSAFDAAYRLHGRSPAVDVLRTRPAFVKLPPDDEPSEASPTSDADPAPRHTLSHAHKLRSHG